MTDQAYRRLGLDLTNGHDKWGEMQTLLAEIGARAFLHVEIIDNALSRWYHLVAGEAVTPSR